MANILLVTSDLACSSQLAGAATRLNATLETLMQPARLEERLSGAAYRLMILDLNTPGIDAAAAVSLGRASSATLQVIAFGPHVHEARLQAAQQAGCDSVHTRGQFYSQLDDLLRRHLPK